MLAGLAWPFLATNVWREFVCTANRKFDLKHSLLLKFKLPLESVMDILSAGEYTGLITRRMTFADAIVSNTVYLSENSNTDWHSHENLHVCFVFQRGKSENRQSTTHSDRAGNVLLYRSEERHRWVTAVPISRSLNIEVGREFLNSNDFTEADLEKAVTNRADAKILMLKIQSEMLHGGTESQASIETLLFELFSDEGTELLKTPPRWLSELKVLLNDEWHRSMSLGELAEILGVHPVTISKHFRKYFSCSLGEYRRRLRIEKSIGLIKNSSQPLAQVALACGFSDQSHFTRNFKASTGLLPKTFRNL